MKAEAKYAGIGTVLIKGNKRAFGRPLDKVNNLLHIKQRCRETDTITYIYKQTKTHTRKNSLEYNMRTNDS
jgi:hypothetical protein